MISVMAFQDGVVFKTKLFNIKRNAIILDDKHNMIMRESEEIQYILSKLTTNSIITITKLMLFLFMRYDLKNIGKELLTRV